MSTWFCIEHLSSCAEDDFASDCTVEKTTWTNQRAMYDRADFAGFGYTYETYSRGPIVVRISAWDETQTNCIANYSVSPTLIYWDYQFSNVEYEMVMRTGDFRPGEIYVDAVPSSPFDAELFEQVRVMHYQSRVGSDLSRMNRGVGGCEANQVSNSFSFHWVFWRAPQVWYWYVRPLTGWGSGYPGEGISASETYFAIVCCSEVSGCPTVDPSFVDAGYPVFTLDPCISGDRQIAIRKDDILIVEGTPLFIPRSVTINDVYLELPPDIAIVDQVNHHEEFDGTRFYDFSVLDTPPEVGSQAEGYRTFHLDRSSFSWHPGLPIAFKFGPDVKYGEKYRMYIRDGTTTETAWQEMFVTPTEVPENPVGPPRRLWIGYTWSRMYYYESLAYYANLGFNLVPKPGYYAGDFESAYSYYAPESRRTKWEEECPGCGLMFGPEASLFHGTSATHGLVDLFGSVLEVTTRTDSMIPLTVPNRAAELTMWQNSIDYFIATGYTDVGYNGYFYREHIRVFGEYLNFTRPEVMNFDVEGFTWGGDSAIIPTVSQSTNFNNRRDAGEDDETLYRRVVDEIFDDIKEQYTLYSPETESTWYYARCYGHPPGEGFQLANWDQYDKHGITCQPELYITHKHPEMLAILMRANKQGCCCKNCGDQSWASPTDANKKQMVPMPSHGCYGEYSAEYTIDWVVQLLTNGATGFQIYPQSYTDDLRDTLHMAEALRIFGTPEIEDIIMDGDLMYHTIRGLTSNVAVGAILLEESLLLGISHLWSAPLGREASFRIPFPTASFEVRDLRAGTAFNPFTSRKEPVNPRIWYEDGYVHFFYEEPKPNLPDILLVSSIRERVTSAVATSVILVLLSGMIFLVILALIVILVVCPLRSGADLKEEKREGEQVSAV